ncbi:MFS general substrate transporter [Penicillium brevicompactum]|uniref:MFS general substrate transporter n=1 Tax=Penicillium brevicompactum TaxID=5074 RepID=A0A9W9V3J2_PENBR|nr:MFS general substrate transporter [Penicillium brevicompactum]
MSANPTNSGETDSKNTTAVPILVRLGNDDEENPQQWSTIYKSVITFQLAMLSMATGIGSSIISPAVSSIEAYFNVTHGQSMLCVSLYLVGFAFGPLIWGPLSELYGRRWALIPSMIGLGLFSIGTAVSQNFCSVLVTRLLAGLFASSPVTNVGAVLGDIWSPKLRGTAIVFYSLTVIGGPTLGPIIGAALVVNPSLGWRWTGYVQAIWSFAVTLPAIFTLPETYPPVLLKAKAQRLRTKTGNIGYYHPHEEFKLSPKTIFTKQISRPLLMLCTEPMVACVAVYASFTYGILYMTLELFPIVFEEERGFRAVISTLPFLALFVGVCFAGLVNLGNQPRYARLVDAAGGKPVPEGRCAPMAIGAIVFAIGLFWFGWTANPQIHWIVPVLAAVFIGAGFNMIFQQSVNFLVDTYQLHAASALSANTFLRSALAAVFPILAKPMCDTLGVGPAVSLLGGIAVLAIPVPFLFMRYGAFLRRKSKFAPLQ